MDFRLFFAYNLGMSDQPARHRVYMFFQDRRGWHCQFLEEDLKTPLPRKLRFASSDRIVQLVERAGGFLDQESRQAFNHGIEIGRGGVILSLTAEQYAKLKRRST
jgi:hypothetical protein